jgi:Flp pilus assembly protein TadG
MEPPSRGLLDRFVKDKSANIAVIFALATVPVLGLVGAAVDMSIINDQRTQLQAALDTAVLFGVRESSDALKIAKADSVYSAEVRARWGTVPAASFSVASGQLNGAATSTVNTQFLRIMGFATVPISVSSAAAATGRGNKVCILLVESPNAQTFLVNSGAAVNGPACEVDVDSTAGVAAMINSGTTLNLAKICIKGGATQNGGTNPVVSTGCAAIANPFVGALPRVTATTCTYSNQVYNPGTVTLSPGTYCGWTNFNGSGTLQLNPGLYVIKNGGMTFNSGWTVTGSGVTFYLVDQNATLTFNGNVKANLSAPTSGTYANILMFEPDGLPQTNLPINGTPGSSISGMMYLPSRNVIINSVSNTTADQTTMVFATLILNATNWQIQPGPLAPSGASSSGGTVRLVR